MTTIAEMKKEDGLFVVLDLTLKSPKEIQGISYEDLLQRISEQNSGNCGVRMKHRKTYPVVELDLSKEGIYFFNWFNYIRLCWANHLIAQIRPEDLSFTFFCIISEHVAYNPNNFRSLFSDKKEGKEDITIEGKKSSKKLDLPAILAQINKVAPIDLFHLLPEFSTDTKASKMARISAFAEMLSPFYAYSMMLCGFPGVRITGTAEDWDKLLKNIRVFRELLSKRDKKKELERYFVAMIDIVEKIHKQASTGVADPEWLKKININTHCGSGHQEAVDGWICEVYNIFWKDNKGWTEPPMPQEFPSHITSVPYKIIYKYGEKDTKDYLLHYGLHVGHLVDRELVPSYHWVVNEIPTTTNPDESLENKIFEPPQPKSIEDFDLLHVNNSRTTETRILEPLLDREFLRNMEKKGVDFRLFLIFLCGFFFFLMWL